MTNVVQLPGTERDVVPLHISEGIEPDNVLLGAITRLKTVVVIGIDNDGELYLASSDPSIARSVLLLHKAINEFVRMSDLELEHVMDNT